MRHINVYEKKEKPSVSPNLPDYEEACKNFDYSQVEKEIAFFDDGSLNIAHNAVDKHVGTDLANKPAYIWTDGEKELQFTFEDVSKLSNKVANMLTKLGIQKGDKVFLFLPRIPEQYYSFLGILKTGAVAATLFAAFGPEALYDRLSDSEAVAIITDSELKERVDKVKDKLPCLKHIILTDSDDGVDFQKEVTEASDEFDVVHTSKDDPAFMLYTSGTTGKPKGVIHRHYALVHEYMTAKWVLDLHPDDVYWCTADPGWVTGIVYAIITPLVHGVTSIITNQRFSIDAWYGTIEKYKVSVWYTAPTAIRMLMKKKSEVSRIYDLSSLRHLLSVGEPLNPEAIRWGLEEYGLPFHDTWWQTETGGMLIVNFPCLDIKLGSMGRPFPGIHAAVIDEQGNELPAGYEGSLAIKKGWPSMMKEIYKNPDKYKSYFNGDWYLSGDKAKKDEDGYFWFVGRSDDVIKTSGERVGPFEVESALIEHEAVAEAGVIGKPDAVRGEIIKAFITLNPGYEDTEVLHEELKKFVKSHLAGHAYPREIEVVQSLPKTRSGKIMRRMLKAKELGQDLGDTSTLEQD